MVSNKTFVCETCGYSSNRKYNLELHQRSPNACEKRLKRQHILNPPQKCKIIPQKVTIEQDFPPQKVIIPHFPPQKVTILQSDESNNLFNCNICHKSFSCKWNKERHMKTCKGASSLQCPTCKKMFSTKQSKHQHIKAGKCVPCKDDKEIEIEDLKQQLEERDKQLEESEAKRIEAENKNSTTVNNYNITNNNNYFDHSINYNNYDNLNVDHITKEDIKRLFNNCRMQYPELSEDLTRMILGPKENQCIYLPEGQKSNTCAVIKDGVEMRKPLIRVLMDLGVQTATLIRDSNVIVRNKKDIVNNQFWADNRNACGLNISDIEYMTDNDKEIVQRNKNIVLDMGDGKITTPTDVEPK